MGPIAIVGIIAAVLVVLGIGTYNRLVTLRNRYKNAFAQIDVQLKRRYDLIPNLVETTKGYLQHEKETLEKVISARNQAASLEEKVATNPGNAEAMRQFSGAEGVLGSTLGRLMAVVESYPDLKGNQAVAELMEDLRSTENRVGFARQAFNDSITIYNTSREKFPAVVLAGAMGFYPAELFEISNPDEREAPKVSFT